jgi:hypothetical protein
MAAIGSVLRFRTTTVALDLANTVARRDPVLLLARVAVALMVRTRSIITIYFL